MARARNIKPGLFKNELLGVADPLLTILFASLWCLADKEGRLEDRPLRIKAETFPYRDNLDVNGYLTELSRLGFIRRYGVDEKRYIQVLEFKKHQTPHHTEKGSGIPAMPENYQEESEGCDLTDTSPLKDRESPKAKRSDSLIPDSLNTDSSIPDSPITDPLLCATTVVAVAPAIEGELLGKEKPEKGVTNETWAAYSEAYQFRYGQLPVRNQSVNAKLAQLVTRLGRDEAPKVAAFFVSINDQFLCKRMHDVGLLLQQAESFRTQWATGRSMTTTRANQIDKTASNYDALQEAILMSRQREQGA